MAHRRGWPAYVRDGQTQSRRGILQLARMDAAATNRDLRLIVIGLFLLGLAFQVLLASLNKLITYYVLVFGSIDQV